MEKRQSEHLFAKGGKKGVLVCLHGSGSSSQAFVPLFGDATFSYTIICPDFPGHGGSWREGPTKAYSISTFRQMVLNILKDYEPEPVFLVGHSLGGHIALEIAKEVSNLAGILIFATPPLKQPLNLDEVYEPNPLGSTYYQEDVSKDLLVETMEAALASPGPMDRILEDFENTDPEFRKRFPASFGEVPDEFQIWKDLDVPKFILHGKGDPFVNFNYLKKLSQEAGSELILFENCGHYPHLEKPDEFKSVLADILDNTFGQ